MQSFRRFLGVNIIACCLLSMPTEARIICWEDSNGESMCDDSVPRSVIHRGISEYDNRGIEHRRFNRVPFEENRKKLLALEGLRLAFDKETARLNDQIESIKVEFVRQKARLSVLQTVVAQAKQRGVQPWDELLDDLEKTSRALEDIVDSLLEKENQQRTLRHQYQIRKRQLEPTPAERPWPKFEPFRAVSATTTRRDLPQVDHLL